MTIRAAVLSLALIVNTGMIATITRRMAMKDNLAEQLDEFVDTLTGYVEHQGFIINDDSKADWAVRKINRYQNNIADAKNLAAERIAQVEAWLKDIEEDNTRQIEFFMSKLAPYVGQQLAGGKSKTYKLPSGNVSLKAKPVEYFIAGEKAVAKNEELTAYVKQSAPEFLKVEETTNWGEFKKTLTVTSSGTVINSDGEVLSFITGVEYPDTVTVKERK
jgi:hypothetical protein